MARVRCATGSNAADALGAEVIGSTTFRPAACRRTALKVATIADVASNGSY